MSAVWPGAQMFAFLWSENELVRAREEHVCVYTQVALSWQRVRTNLKRKRPMLYELFGDHVRDFSGKTPAKADRRACGESSSPPSRL